VTKAASTLRNRVLAMEPGAFLGSEDDLIEQLGVSRPTFRQAARLLAHEELLTIRRGVGGGFFVRRPSIDTVSQSAATYLRSRDTTLDQVSEVAGRLTLVALNLALSCRDEHARERLATLRGKLLAQGEHRETPSELMNWEMELSDAIGEMSGNPALALCLHMFNRFGMDQSAVAFWAHHPKRVAKWSGLRIRVIEALLARDETATHRVFGERARLIRSWIQREQSNRKPSRRR
jgi:DNA-binding FadR family transcriptional regulator